MEILIISYNYPPSNTPAAQRPFFMAKYLGRKINKIHVITPHLSNALDDWDEQIPNVQIHKAGKIDRAEKIGKSNKSSLKGVILSFISTELLIPDKSILWYHSGLKKALDVINKNKNIKCIFSTSPMMANHLIAKKIKNKTGLPWIADFRDFHYIENKEFKKFGIRRPIDKNIEHNILKNANVISFISEAMKNEYSHRYKDFSNKFSTIYNGYDLEEYKDDSLIQKKVDSKWITVFYAGTFYSGHRSPFPMLDLAKKFNRENLGVKIKVEIAGRISKELLTKIEAYKENVSVDHIGLLARKEILKKYRSADLLWLIVGNSKSHYLGIPLKAFEYLAVGVPILCFGPKNSEIEQLLKRTKSGIVLDKADAYNIKPKNILNLVSSKINIESEERRIYTRQYQASQLYSIIKNLVKDES